MVIRKGRVVIRKGRVVIRKGRVVIRKGRVVIRKVGRPNTRVTNRHLILTSRQPSSDRPTIHVM